MTRSWAGVAMADRQKIRRGELLAAGVALLGAPEGPAVSVRAVCRATGLTERYFYESFADREQFVLGVYEYVAEQAREMLLAEISVAQSQEALATAAIRGFIDLIEEKPDSARVLLLAPFVEPGLGGRGLELAPGFTALVEEQLTEVADADERQMVATGVVGALSAIFIELLDGKLTIGRDRLAGHCYHLLEDANRRRR